MLAAAMLWISGRANLAGVIGWPVAHSRSPRLHGFWLDRLGIDGAYVPLAVPPERFSLAVRGLMAAGFRGLNVTIPHKLAAFELCDAVEASAARAGAVNTLVFAEGRIIGSNTDGEGFLANLRAHGVDPAAGPALVLGGGGAARAVAAALQALGVVVTVAGRSREQVETLAAALPARDGLRPLAVLDWEAVADALADHALLVNATSAGMAGEPGLKLDLTTAQPELAVADLVYVPLETPLLVAARARGLTVVGGLGMLLYQAQPGFAAWFGQTPEVDVALAEHVAADLLPAAA